MITNNNCVKNIRIYFISYFLILELIDTALVTFVDLVFVIFVTFVDALSVAFTISSDIITEYSIALATYSIFSQLHVGGSQI